jgi:hypothetical protein
VALTLGSAFIGATSLLVASVALGARWEGRDVADRELAEAKDYELAVSRHPAVVEAETLQATLNAYSSADRPVQKALESADQRVGQAETEADAREKRVQANFEKLKDAEQGVDQLLRLNRPAGVRGALRRAGRRLARPLRSARVPEPTRRAARGART